MNLELVANRCLPADVLSSLPLHEM
jgi:hypothetical protein